MKRNDDPKIVRVNDRHIVSPRRSTSKSLVARLRLALKTLANPLGYSIFFFYFFCYISRHFLRNRIKCMWLVAYTIYRVDTNEPGRFYYRGKYVGR